MASADMIDWDVAVGTARRLVRPGPTATLLEARQIGEELRRLVPIAERHVAELTGLVPPDLDVPVAVVDRVGWVQANVDGFQILLEPLTEKLTAKRGSRPPSPLVTAVGSRVTGVQVGTLMAYVASRVLGQFELFVPAGGAGRLTLVAPNIVETERKLGVDPSDFRMWVTLHEVTHRTQFTAVPWLREYFLSLVHEFLDASDLDPAQLARRLRDAIGAIRGSDDRPGVSFVEAIQTPEQRAVLGRMQALMSLLEGHADVVMDRVGPEVVPTVADIRTKFEKRRKGSGPIDRMIRSLLGLDLKMRQYAEGAAFVRHVIDAEGMDRFNTVWTSPDTLPRPDEVTDPDAWRRRVLSAPDRDEIAVAADGG
ncbi:MAG TPA: zinc-dependent metalloprotease [Mycobacteriales bacterium]|nr:zinc-dependent metalloprotease [Mycobacteriales bacterium]